MLTNFTEAVEEREEVWHTFWKKKKRISSLSLEQHFIAVKSVTLE